MKNYIFAEIDENLYAGVTVEGNFTPETAGSAGIDLRADVHQSKILEPGERALVPTGVKLALPENHEAQVRPRSGLAYKKGVTVLNSPGTIDSDYRGDIGVLLINHGEEPFVVERGARIAQLVVAQYETTSAVWRHVDDITQLMPSERGAGGFGSTGTN